MARFSSAGGGDGIPGPKGNDGDSAYDIAVANGFVGTEQEWLDSLGGSGTVSGTLKGTWDQTVQYSINDIVAYENGTYYLYQDAPIGTPPGIVSQENGISFWQNVGTPYTLIQQIATEQGLTEVDWVQTRSSVADFNFSQYVEDDVVIESTMSINDHTLIIETNSSDPNIEASMNINSAGELAVTANYGVDIYSTNGPVHITSYLEGDTPSFWEFGDRTLKTPNNSEIQPGVTPYTEVTSSSVTVDSDYLGQTSTGSSTGVFLFPTPELQWYVDNIGPGGDIGGQGSIVFADQTSLPITVAYTANISGTDAIVIQFDGNKAVEYPINLYGTRNIPRVTNSLDIQVSDDNDIYNVWSFRDDGILSGPNEGYLPVYGISNSPGGSLELVSYDENSININSGSDINIGSMAVPAALNISTYLGAYINSARTAEYGQAAKSVATLGDIENAAPTEVSFDVVGGSLGNPPTFDGDPLFFGSYVKTGPLVHVEIEVDFSNITNFGSGQYFLDLPFVSKRDVSFNGVLHDVSGPSYYSITGICEKGEGRAFLFYTGSNGQLTPFQQGSPRTLQSVDHFSLHGTYIDDNI